MFSPQFDIKGNIEDVFNNVNKLVNKDKQAIVLFVCYSPYPYVKKKRKKKLCLHVTIYIRKSIFQLVRDNVLQDWQWLDLIMPGQ